MAEGPQYTSCVSAASYKPLDVTPEALIGVAGLVSAFFSGGIGLILSLGAFLSAFQKVCEYMLKGKLICLADQVCAIGMIASFEEVGEDKPFPKNIDNDYCVNLLLGPHDFGSFGLNFDSNLAKARGAEQGALLTISMTMPPDKNQSAGYATRFFFDFNTGSFHRATQAEIDAGANLVTMPVLHCECEGSRIKDMLNALMWYPGGSSKFCKKNFFTKFLCKIVQTAFAPVVIVSMLEAWGNAKGGSANDAREDPESGTLQFGDIVMIKGRFVFDAAHGGYNEIHAVKTIQKIPETYPPDFKAWREKWCGLASAIPPGDPPLTPGTTVPSDPTKITAPPGATPQQIETWNGMRRLENRWFYHPVLDGCRPGEDDDDDSGGKP